MDAKASSEGSFWKFWLCTGYVSVMGDDVITGAANLFIGFLCRACRSPAFGGGALGGPWEIENGLEQAAALVLSW